MFVTLYRAVRGGFLDVVSDDLDELTGAPAEDPEAFFRRVIPSTPAGRA